MKGNVLLVENKAISGKKKNVGSLTPSKPLGKMGTFADGAD